MKRRHRGLTLIEIAVALALAAFLAVVALPAYRDYALRAIVAEAVDVVGPAKATVEEYASFHGKLPRTEDISLPFVTSPYVASTLWAASGAAGTILVATRSAPGSEQEALDAKTIAVTAFYNPSTKRVAWVCGGTRATTVDGKYLPAACQ